MSRVSERIKEAARSMPLDKMTTQAFNKDMKASNEKDPSKKDKLENQARSIRATMDMASLKKKTTKESFSDWRSDLREVVDIPSSEPKTDERAKRKVTGKGVNNKVVINPPMREAFEEIGGVILEVTEVDEAYYGGEEQRKKDEKKVAYEKQLKKMLPKRGFDQLGREIDPRSGKLKEENLEEKLSKADLEKMQDEKDKKEARKAGKVNENNMGNLQTRRARQERNIAMIDMKIAAERNTEAKKAKKANSDLDKSTEAQQQREEKFVAPYKELKTVAREKAKKKARGQVQEKIDIKKADMGDVVKDFYKSDAPQFKGKSKEKKREMAIAAKLSTEETETVTERTRYAKETGKDFTTGKSSEKGGTRSGDSAYDKVRANMKKTGGLMSDRGKAIQPQGKKKEKGAKGYKGVTPVDKIKARLSKKRAPKPSIGSRFD
jgi:hypothetical protein